MQLPTQITLVEWIIMIAVLALIGAAYWLIEDSRKRGMHVGGKACGGCPHYCQINRNCDGSEKAPSDSNSETTGEPPSE